MNPEANGWRNEKIIIKNETYFVEKKSKFQETNISDRLILAEKLTPLTGKGFLRFDLMSEELQQDVANHVVESPRLTLTRDIKNEIVAFIASETKIINNQVIYHLGGIIIDPTLQRSGLAKTLLSQEFLETKADILVFRTQSKKMLGLASKLATLDAELTREFAPLFYPENLDGYINRRVYRGGHSLYEDENQFQHDAIESIDWRQGDSLVACGWIINP